MNKGKQNIHPYLVLLNIDFNAISLSSGIEQKYHIYNEVICFFFN